jgi:Peptidase propeptide and YPEB domain
MRKSAITTAAALAVVLGGAGVAYAVGGDDESEGRATGPGAERAKAAALELVPGGTANEVERDDEKGATWEVEVARPDGSTVDVRLDAELNKVAIDQDSEAEDR